MVPGPQLALIVCTNLFSTPFGPFIGDRGGFLFGFRWEYGMFLGFPESLVAPAYVRSRGLRAV